MSRNEERAGEILRSLARGGLSDREVGRLATELQEIRQSAAARHVQQDATRAPHQPRWRNLDMFD